MSRQFFDNIPCMYTHTHAANKHKQITEVVERDQGDA